MCHQNSIGGLEYNDSCLMEKLCGTVRHYINGKRRIVRECDTTGWPWMIYMFSAPPLSSHSQSIHPSLWSSGCKSELLSVPSYLTVLSSLSLYIIDPISLSYLSFTLSFCFCEKLLVPGSPGNEIHKCYDGCLTFHPITHKHTHK